LINERMAQEFWPNQDPIGKRIKVGTDPDDPKTQWRTIVGIVRDVSQYALVEKPPLQMYVPSTQFASRFNSIVVKTTSDPVSMFASVRKAILGVDPDQAVYNIATMDQLLSKSIGLQHFLMVLLIAFAGLAVLLAAIGIYGVMSYDVSQRTREIGIRMALGAQRKAVLNQVLGNGMKLAVIGVVAGCAAALFATRLVVTFLFQVSPTNVANFLVVSLIVLVVAAAACLIPGIRAARTNPLRSLRHE
jgi:ABC-type antimicrobial peptide transport system permease subunit